jgi:hypothetical protein
MPFKRDALETNEKVSAVFYLKNFDAAFRYERLVLSTIVLILVGCAEDVRPISVSQSPSGQTVAVLERSSGLGAFDSYVYDAYVKMYAKEKIYVAVLRYPRNARNQEGVDFIWKGDNHLVISFSAAAEANLTRDVVRFSDKIIKIELEGEIEKIN